MNLRRGLSVLLAGVTLAAAAPTEKPPFQRPVVSFELLFHDLKVQGEWLRLPDRRWVWRPRNVERDWRPLTRGTWVVTDLGWYWLSEDPWGYVTSHYGRWEWQTKAGWVWLPDREWASAWALWAYGDEGIAWCPLTATTAPLVVPEEAVNPDPRSAVWTIVQWRDLDKALIPRAAPGGQKAETAVCEAIALTSATAVRGLAVLPTQGWKAIRPATAEGLVRNPGPDSGVFEARTKRQLRPCRVLQTRYRREVLLVGNDQSILVTFRPVIRESAEEIQALITSKDELYRKMRQRNAKTP